MEAFRYRIVTEWSDEDEVFIARVPALAGCAAHGNSPEEAAKQVREAALGILESMRAHREMPPHPDTTADYSGQLRLRLPKSLHARITRLASADDTSINTLLVSMLSEAVRFREHTRHSKLRNELHKLSVPSNYVPITRRKAAANSTRAKRAAKR